MKFIVNSALLSKQLQDLSGILNSSNALPILHNFLFDISEKELKISASDLESTMTTIMPIEAKEEAIIAVPAKLLLDSLKYLPEQPLTFTIDSNTFGIEISSDNGKYKITGQNGDEFPKAALMEAASTVVMDGGVLSAAINKTLFASGNDELRPVMSGIYFELGKEFIRFVTTDAHRLVRYTRTDCHAENSASFIIPKKPLSLLKNIVATSESPVKIEYTDAYAMFAFDNIELVCRLIEGKYPNYDAVIPKNNPNKLTIGRSELLQSVRRVSIFANKTTYQVRLNIQGSELHISSEDLDYANEASERMSCNYNGEDMEIGFNSRFLVDILSNMTGENIIVELSAANRAGIFVAEANQVEGEDILMLVMPVMLNS